MHLIALVLYMPLKKSSDKYEVIGTKEELCLLYPSILCTYIILLSIHSWKLFLTIYSLCRSSINAFITWEKHLSVENEKNIYYKKYSILFHFMHYILTQLYFNPIICSKAATADSDTTIYWKVDETFLVFFSTSFLMHFFVVKLTRKLLQKVMIFSRKFCKTIMHPFVVFLLELLKLCEGKEKSRGKLMRRNFKIS